LITWASCGALTNAVWNANSPNLWNNITRIKYTVHGWQSVSIPSSEISIRWLCYLATE
jgi:hypothetical protein